MNIRKMYLGAVLFSAMASAQVGINTQDPKVTLHIEANENKTLYPESTIGLLVPRVATNPTKGSENGQLIYNTTNNQFYYWNGTTWLPISNQSTSSNTSTLNSKFVDTRNSTAINITNSSAETAVTGASMEFTLDAEKAVQFYSTVNFMGTSAAFAPVFKLKLTNTATQASEIIDQASNTFLSDGLSQYFGNLPLMTIKNLAAGSYKVEVIAHYNNCCNFDFTYQVGGNSTPVSILIQYP